MSIMDLEMLFREEREEIKKEEIKERKPLEEKVVAKNVTIPRKLVEKIKEKMKREGLGSFSYVLSQIIEKGLEDEKI